MNELQIKSINMLKQYKNDLYKLSSYCRTKSNKLFDCVKITPTYGGERVQENRQENDKVVNYIENTLELDKMLIECTKRIDRVQLALSKLDEIERCLLFDKYINKLSWKQLEDSSKINKEYLRKTLIPNALESLIKNT